MIRKRAELSIEIRLFLLQALVNRVANKFETILAQKREPPQTYSRYKMYQISKKENKSVSSVYVYVLVFYSFVVFVVLFVGDKSRKKTIAWQEKGNKSSKYCHKCCCFRKNIVIFAAKNTKLGL